MQDRTGTRGDARPRTVRIVAHDLGCSTCGRSLLTGERAQIVTEGQETRVTCELCLLAAATASEPAIARPAGDSRVSAASPARPIAPRPDAGAA